MITLKIDHWCPRCRVMQEDWRLLDTKDGNGRILRRGDVWETLLPTKTYDKCEECQTEIHGEVLVGQKKQEDPTIYLLGVRELGFAN